MNINANNIHILIGYKKENGLSEDFRLFKKRYKNHNIYTYEDTRENTRYLSSIRPHILAKHFAKYPNLSSEIFFYHDSDIIFSRLPNFELLAKGETWYSSNTKDYISSKYILETAGESLFHEMCSAVGIDNKIVKENDNQAGGAQYIIKRIDASFWRKIESDCEKIYTLLDDAENRLNQDRLEPKPFIQKWCADMWALWWNALVYEKRFEIHEELDFCWADSPILEWEKKTILHYTGGIKKDSKSLFRKANYILHSPFYDNHSLINPNTCSYPFIQLINKFNLENLNKRKDLKDFSFLIPIKIDSPDRLRNIQASTSYIHKNFKTNIIVMEIDKSQKLSPENLPPGVNYIFKKTNNPRLFRTHFNNEMIKICASKYIALYDADVIIPVKQLNQAVKILRNKKYKVVSPYDGTFLNVDPLLKEIFIKLMDDSFLIANKYKTGMPTKRSYGGCLLLDRNFYIQAGMENENLTSWGPDDIERVKRMQILGHKTMRIKGSLFHLHHERKIDSGYSNAKEYEDLMQTYLHIANMNKNDLLNHVKNWEWAKQ